MTDSPAARPIWIEEIELGLDAVSLGNLVHARFADAPADATEAVEAALIEAAPQMFYGESQEATRAVLAALGYSDAS